jgi:hypothetical protein
VRDWIEGVNSAAAARTIFDRLPRSSSAQEALFERGQATARRMSWEVVATDYLLPGLRKLQR